MHQLHLAEILLLSTHALPFPACRPALSTSKRRELLCVYQLHSAAINCLIMHDSFIITGSDDKLLRVWPLDFKDYLMEVKYGGLEMLCRLYLMECIEGNVIGLCDCLMKVRVVPDSLLCPLIPAIPNLPSNPAPSCQHATG